MCKTLEITQDKAQAAFNNATPEGKKLLADLLGEKNLSMKITDRVKSFADVLEIKKIRPEYFQQLIAGMPADTQAYEKLKLVVDVLNEGWKADWTDEDEYKYFPVYDQRKGFSFFRVINYFWVCGAGSRLCYVSRDIAEYAGKQFLHLYKTLLTA